MLKQKVVNGAVLFILFCFIASTVYLYFASLPVIYILSLNFYAGVVFWVICLLTTLLKTKASVYLVLIMLLLYVFNILSFSSGTYSIIFISHQLYNSDFFTIYSPGIQPFGILLFIVYFIFNKKFVLNAYYMARYPSDEELDEKYAKEKKFYFDKFFDFSDEEFKKILLDYKMYPATAQAAINEVKLIKEK